LNRTGTLRLEAHYRTFGQGNLDDFDEQLAADFIDNGNQQSRGTEPAKDFARSFRRGFPDMTVSVLQSIVEEKWVAIRARWHGTHTGTVLGHEPTGGRSRSTGRSFGASTPTAASPSVGLRSTWDPRLPSSRARRTRPKWLRTA
jgi:predicted ester cyclase